MSVHVVTEALLAAVDRHEGNIRAAAREVGITPNRAYTLAARAGVRGRRGPGSRTGPKRGEFLRLRAQGVSRRAAAAQVGTSMSVAREWDLGIYQTGKVRIFPDGRRIGRERGSVRMPGVNTTTTAGLKALDATLHARFLTIQEREVIADLRREGASLRAVARELGRPVSTIKRELDTYSDAAGRYRPYRAQRAWAASRARPKSSKLAQDGPLREYVIDKLREQWSPEQIHNVLIREYPDDESMRVATETIYQAIYVQARGGLKREIKAALRSGRARRKPHRSPEQRQSRFADPMVMISDRPAEIEDRAVPGHWEGDLILGQDNASAIATLVERATRYTLLAHLPGSTHDATTVRDALVAVMSTLPEHLRGSLTWDQGSEMALHASFTLATGAQVYFCDPHSPWQRGTNENTNGLLRQYFPKGTNLSVHGPEDLELVAQRLNSRPRKTLSWDTPAERLRDLLTTT